MMKPPTSARYSRMESIDASRKFIVIGCVVGRVVPLRPPMIVTPCVVGLVVDPFAVAPFAVVPPCDAGCVEGANTSPAGGAGWAQTREAAAAKAEANTTVKTRRI